MDNLSNSNPQYLKVNHRPLLVVAVLLPLLPLIRINRPLIKYPEKKSMTIEHPPAQKKIKIKIKE